MLYIAIVQSLDPSRSLAFSWVEFRLQIISSLEVFGAVFAAIYLALYSRFASQWTYLATLYNQIKQTEADPTLNALVIAQWKAGFIEDAIEVHLARKKMFAIVIKGWGSDVEVKRAFVNSVPSGRKVFDKLMADINKIVPDLPAH